MTRIASKKRETIILSKNLLNHLLKHIKSEDGDALEFYVDDFVKAVKEANLEEGYALADGDLN